MNKPVVKPMLAKLVALPSELGACAALLADTGYYYSAANVVACAQARVTPMIAIKREHHHLSLNERLAADAPAPAQSDADHSCAETAISQRCSTPLKQRRAVRSTRSGSQPLSPPSA